MKKELWQDINGYKGYYQISNYGNVRSLDRPVYTIAGKGYRIVKGKLIKGSVNNSGYKMVVLKKENKPKGLTIHRLVALHFIPNPNGFPDVNHKDENKFNNSFENLEWVSHEYNMNYGERAERSSRKLRNTRLLSNNGRAVKIINLDTKEIFNTILEASIKYNIGRDSISQCCRNKSNSAGSYKWMYYDNYLNMITLGEVTE